MFITTAIPAATPETLAKTGYDSFLSSGLTIGAGCCLVLGASVVVLARRARRPRHERLR
jgi:LPXTG-motif cell wall-anchored protein